MKAPSFGKHAWIGCDESGCSKDYVHCLQCGTKWYTTGRGTPIETDPYSRCFGAHELAVGHIVTVRAWWANNTDIECEIVQIRDIGPSIRPLSGNPHWRMVRWEDVNV